MNQFKQLLIFLVLIFLVLPLIHAQTIQPLEQTQVYFFYGNGCPHCANVEASGVLEKLSKVTLQKIEIYNNEEGRNLFTQMTEQLNIPLNQRGIPLVIIEKSGNYTYLVGDKPIIDDLEKTIINFSASAENPAVSKQNITLWAVIITAIIDSINPCAFSVLIFLMISLMKIGSSKRALKAGLIYTFAVFLTYLLSGFGIFKVIQSFTSITHYIYLGAGILILIAGLIEIKDFFWYGKIISLKIPDKAKPILEKFMNKGTIPAMIILGILVSLFELPCTGGIYLGILTLIAANKINALGYLLLYNFIFVLPLIIITLIIYKGTSPEVLENWNNKEKKFMRLAAGIIMLALGIYILMF